MTTVGKMVIVTLPGEEGMECHVGPHGEAPGLVRRQRGGHCREEPVYGFCKKEEAPESARFFDSASGVFAGSA